MKLFAYNISPLEDTALFAHALTLISSQRKKKVLALRRPQDQRRSLGAGLILRYGLAALGYSEQDMGIANDAKGKPHCTHMPHVQFNLSHSGAVVLGGFAVGCAVGVDVEQYSPMEYLALAKRFFHPSEYECLVQETPAQQARQFFRIWTRRESCLKAVGCGLTVQPASLSVVSDSTSTVLNGIHWHIREYPAPDGYALAVCTQSPSSWRLPEWLHSDMLIVARIHS